MDSLSVLVTGATGLTGYHTVQTLLSAGHRVKAFVRSPEKARRVFGRNMDAIEVAQGDIQDASSVREAVSGCDTLIHCAALVVAGRTSSPEALIEANVSGTRNVIGEGVDAGIDRLVHVSSLSTLFRGDGTVLTEESEPRESKLPYARSKFIAEEYVRGLQAEGAPVKIVYPGTILAPGDPGLSESMNALRVFIRDLVPVTTGGIQIIDARDLGTAHARILESKPGPGRYLIGGTFLRWPELAEIIEEKIGRPPRTLSLPAPLFRAAGSIADLARKVFPIDFPLSAEAAAYVTRWDPVPNSKALAEMGVELRDVRETIGDSLHWLYEAGHL